jgi:hypothetical protein
VVVEAGEVGEGVVRPKIVSGAHGLRGVHVIIDVAVRESRHRQEAKQYRKIVEEHVQVRQRIPDHVTETHVKMEETRSLVDVHVCQVGQEPAVSQVSEAQDEL